MLLISRSLQEISTIIQDLKKVERQLAGRNILLLLMSENKNYSLEMSSSQGQMQTLISSCFLLQTDSNRHDGGPRWYSGCPVQPGADESSS